MADRFNMFSRSKPLPGWNRQSANADGEYYDGGRLRTIPKDVVAPPLRGDVFTGEELNILPGSVNERALGIESNANSTLAQPPINRGYVPTGDRDRDITSYLTNTFSDPDEEDRIRRQTRNRMAIMAVGDAIRQMGNIYHTTNYAPSQRFNNPLENEYGRYYTQKRLRDADRYKEMVMQQRRDKLEADQRQREFENALKTDYNNARIGKLESDAKAANDRVAETVRTNKANEEIRKQRAADSKANADRTYELNKWAKQDASRRGWANYNRLVSGGGRGSSGGGSGSSSNGYRYDTANGGAISMSKNWNATQKKQWEQWMRSKGMFTKDYEDRLSNATASERKDLIDNAIAFALKNYKSAADYAIRNFGATQVRASNNATSGNASVSKPKKTVGKENWRRGSNRSKGNSQSANRSQSKSVTQPPLS